MSQDQDLGCAELAGLYVGSSMSLTDISREHGISVSTARFRLHRVAMLRTRAQGMRIAADAGKYSNRAGVSVTFTEEWRRKLSMSALKRGEANAKGFSLKPNGYIEITRGPHKGRMQHVVVMEELIGRSLLPDECVHHIDENRANNSPENLQLMTRSEHASLHAKQQATYRKRKKNGQFE